MSDPEVLRLKFGDIATLLLGGHIQPSPPPDWECWKEPASATPIDEKITSLIRRNDIPRLRLAPELESHDIACPFYSARFAIAVAVDAATAAAADDPVEMAARWLAQEQAARQAAEAVATISETLLQSARRPTPRLPFLETPELVTAYKNTLMLRQMGTFQRIADDARRWGEFYQHTRGTPWDIWRRVFVADLGFAWTVLTGTAPARGEGFISFVADAFASVCDEEVVWENSVRTILELDVDWNNHGLSFAEIQKLFSHW